MRNGCCPTCGQMLRPQRYGVFFPPRKADIIDAVKGHAGITQLELSRRFGVTLDAIRSHVYQINEMLAGTDHAIRSVSHGGYEIMRSREVVQNERREGKTQSTVSL